MWITLLALASLENVSAGSDGAFHYRVDLSGNPIRGGRIAYETGLTYTSTSRNSVAGYGWALGESFIEIDLRYVTPRTVAGVGLNGALVDVSYSARDHNGQCDLVETAPSTYRCRNERSYRRFVKRKIGARTVWDVTDGLGTLYRYAVTSRDVRWYLSDIVDTNNNWLRIAYRTRDFQSGCTTVTNATSSLWPDFVAWNNLRHATPQTNDPDMGAARCDTSGFKDRMHFTYEGRADLAWETSASGGLDTLAERLVRVEVESRNESSVFERLRTYHLVYGGNPFGPSLLMSVQLTGFGCASIFAGGCGLNSLPVTSFNYTHLPLLYQPAQSWSLPGLPSVIHRGSATVRPYQVHPSDFDGDARFEVLQHDYSGQSAALNRFEWGSNGTQTATLPQSGQIEASQFLDLTGDGRPEIIEPRGYRNPNEWPYFENNGSGYSQATSIWDVSGPAAYMQSSLDPTLATKYAHCGATPLGCVFEIEDGDTNLSGDAIAIRDLSGDGRADYVVYAGPGLYWVFIAADRGFAQAPIAWTFDTLYGDAPVAPPWLDHIITRGEITENRGRIIELNGDGAPDYMLVNSDGIVRWFLNTGRSFQEVPVTGVLPKEALRTVSDASSSCGKGSFADINNDGLPDLLLANQATDLWLNTGSGFALAVEGFLVDNCVTRSTIDWRDPDSGQTHGWYDVNSDGAVDYVMGTRAGSWSVSFHERHASGASASYLIDSVSDGLGASVQIGYTPSTDASNVHLPYVQNVVSSITHRAFGTQAPPSQTWSYNDASFQQDPQSLLFRSTGYETLQIGSTTGLSERREMRGGFGPDAGLLARARQLDVRGCVITDKETTWTPFGFGSVHIAVPTRTIERKNFFAPGRVCTTLYATPNWQQAIEHGVRMIDEHGLPTELYDLGDRNLPGDELYTKLEYAQSATIKGARARSSVFDTLTCTGAVCTYSGQLKQDEWRYDGPLSAMQAHGFVTKGNVTHRQAKVFEGNTPGNTVLLERFAHDAFGNVVTHDVMHDATNGERVTVVWDSVFALLAISESRGAAVPGSTLQTAALPTVKTYDFSKAKLATEMDPSGIIHVYETDTLLRPKGELIRKGASDLRLSAITYGMDRSGQRSWTETILYHDDQRFEQVRLETDAYNRKVKETKVLGATQASQITGYDGFGRKAYETEASTDESTFATFYFYDDLGRIRTQIRQPVVLSAITVPPESSESKVAADRQVSRFSYGMDANGSFTRSTEPFDPQAPHNPTATRAPAATRWVDALGQVVLTEDPGGRRVKLYRDRLRRVNWAERTLVTPQGVQLPVGTGMTLDSLGRVIQVDDPDKGRARFTTNLIGLATFVERSDAMSSTATQRLAFEYDTLGRVRRKQGQVKSGSQWIADNLVDASFIYDATAGLAVPSAHPSPTHLKGRLVATTDARGVSYHGYDDFGRATVSGRGTPTGIYSAHRSLSRAGRVERIDLFERIGTTTSPIESIEYEYTSAHALRRVSTIQSGTKTTQYEVTRFSELLVPLEILRGGVTELQTVDAQQRLTGRSYKASGTQLLAETLSSWDARGDVLQIADTLNTVPYSYTYDDARQLLSARAGTCTVWPCAQLPNAQSFWHRYDYDSLGNIRAMNDVLQPAKSRAFSYRDDGALPQQTIGYIENNRGYAMTSARGNVTSESSNGVTLRLLNFSVEDRLVSLMTSSGIRSHYYDAHGTRVVAAAATGTTHFLGDVLELDLNAQNVLQKTKWHVSVGGQRILTRERQGTTRSTRHYLFDLRDNMRVVTSAAGAVLDRVAYLPFGQLDAHAAIDGVGFGGYTCEPDAQTWFAGPRFYDSKLGRFLSADAIIPNLESPIAYNRYAYANNNPMMFSDPSGRHPVLLGLLVGAVMGGINGLFLSYQVGASIEESIGYVFAGIGLGAILGASSGIVSELASGLSKPLGDTFSSILTSAVGAAARGVLAPLYSLERIALHPDGGYSIDAIGFISSIVGAASNSGMSALTAGLGDSAQYVLSNFSSAVASYSVEATGAAFLEQRSGQAHRDALNKLAVSLLSASLGAGGIGLLQGSVDSYTRRTIMGTVTGVIEPFALYGLKVSTWVSLDKTEQTPLYDEDRARFEASAWEAAFKSLASNAISQSVYMFTLELP